MKMIGDLEQAGFKVDYDADTNVGYLSFPGTTEDSLSVHTQRLGDGSLTVDYDIYGNVLGVEFFG